MTKQSISTLVLMCAMAVPVAATDYKGATPKDGATYKLYNIGTGKFLSSANGVLTLGGAEIAVTLKKTADGYYTLSTTDGNIGATLWGTPCNDGSGKYSQWKFTKVKDTDDVYTLANRNREASATFSLYQDNNTGALALEPAQPGAQFAPAQWKLIGSSEPEIIVANISEDAATYTMPTETNVTVKLKLTLTAGQWNTICLPFDISRELLLTTFGEDTQLAEFTDVTDELLRFNTTSQGISRGYTYLINPQKVANDAKYTFEGINTFSSTPESTGIDDVELTGTFTVTTMPVGAFTINDGILTKHTNADTTNGLRGYFTDSNTDSHIWTWALDGVTGISVVNSTDGAVYDMYNTAGQKVKANATGKENMPKGIYIINGKKLTK